MTISLRIFAACLGLLCCAGCPPTDDQVGGVNATDGSIPLEPLPALGKLLEYDGLKLGMSSLEVAQLYNAPDGKGEGFERLVQDFGAVQHHFIKFETAEGAATRLIVLALLRDELYMIVDRRDGLPVSDANLWRESLTESYGKHSTMTIGDAQWRWGPENGVELIYTQDNATEHAVSAHVVLSFKAYEDASYSYLADWEKANPDYKVEGLPF